MTDICVLPQFNDALMYTTPVQSAQYKLNSVLSLAGMKVRHTEHPGPSFLFVLLLYELIYCETSSEAAFQHFCCLSCVLQVSKPSQEAYQNELNIESVERSFILSARSGLRRDDQLFRQLYREPTRF